MKVSSLASLFASLLSSTFAPSLTTLHYNFIDKNLVYEFIYLIINIKQFFTNLHCIARKLGKLYKIRKAAYSK